MNLRKFRPEVGQFVRVVTENDALLGTLTRAGRTSIEIHPLSTPSGARLRIGRDDVRDVETRYADLSAFIPHPGSTNYIMQPITSEEAVSNTIAIYACVSLIAGTIGSLGLSLYRATTGQIRQGIEYDTALQGLPGRGYPGTLARLLDEAPNPEQSSVEFWETVVGHIELQGEAFVNVVRGNDGRPAELWILRPDRMNVFRDPVTKEKFYVYEMKAAAQVGQDPTAAYSATSGPSAAVKRIWLSRDEIMHIPGLSFDGIRGISPISVARTAIQGEQGAERYADSFYRNAAMPSGIVTVPKGPQDRFSERAKMYRDALQSKYGGMTNAGRLAVVEEGVSWQQTGMTMVDQQFIEQRKWSVVEIARLFGVPPHLIGDVEKSTSWGTGIEEQTLGFLTYKLRPIIERIEAAISRDCGLVPGVKTLADEHLAAEFDVEEILRTNTKARYETYATGIQWGILTRADARSMENLPPIDGLDKPTFPANMQIIGETPVPQPTVALAEAMAAFITRDQPPTTIIVPNEASEQGGALAESVEGLRNELRAVELFGRVKDDLQAIHALSNEAHESFEATRLAAQELADSTAAAVDRSAAATEALAAESRAVQTELFTELETLKQPRRRTVIRNEEGFITGLVDDVEELASTNGHVTHSASELLGRFDDGLDSVHSEAEQMRSAMDAMWAEVKGTLDEIRDAVQAAPEPQPEAEPVNLAPITTATDELHAAAEELKAANAALKTKPRKQHIRRDKAGRIEEIEEV